MQASIITDQLEYVRLYAPSFPSEDRTTTPAEIDRLHGYMRDFQKQVTSADAQQWFTLATTEIDDALVSYESGDIAGGKQLLEKAAEHVRAAASRKRIRPSFIVSPDGKAEPVD